MAHAEISASRARNASPRMGDFPLALQTRRFSADSTGRREPQWMVLAPNLLTTYTIDDLLETMVALGASDLHVTVGSHPVIRLNGQPRAAGRSSRASPLTTPSGCSTASSRREQQKHLEINRQIDVSYSIPGLARFRVNVYFQRESLGARLPHDPRRAEDARGSRAADAAPRALRTSRAASSSSRARPAPVSRRRSRRDRRDQPHARRPHHDDRGPDRVPAPPQALHRQPARDRARRRQLRRRACAARFARTPT